MKGLLLKDFYNTVKYCKQYILILIIFFAVSLSQATSVFFMLYPVVLISMIPVTLMIYDETEHWNTYCMAMPYTRAEIVSVKYMEGLIGAVIMAVFTIICQTVRFCMEGSNIEIWGISQLFISVMAISVLPAVIILPMNFHFGTTKGRITQIVTICLICAVLGILTASNVDIMDFMQIKVNDGVLLAAAALLYAASWLLSIKLYQRRDL